MMNILKYIYSIPGYIFLILTYFFPTEWGKKRNVASSGRQWRDRAKFAPIYSTLFYAATSLIFITENNTTEDGLSKTQQNNQETISEPIENTKSEKSNSQLTEIKKQPETKTIPDTKSKSTHKQKIDNESEEAIQLWIMENEKQYHGEDPIIRSRLGLPNPALRSLKISPEALQNLEKFIEYDRLDAKNRDQKGLPQR